MFEFSFKHGFVDLDTVIHISRGAGWCLLLFKNKPNIMLEGEDAEHAWDLWNDFCKPEPIISVQVPACIINSLKTKHNS
jgi:hypothetical protein